ncbi:MAG TPA: trypsin-like peptidase domain-containing protein [Candidatus Baltobacteraceae bacterium]
MGAIIGSFLMMLYASTHFANVAGPGHSLPAVSAAPLAGGGSDQDRIVTAVKRVLPSVVSIDVVINGVQQVPVDPFGQFYQNVPYKARASGSGFVISKDGMIVTNAHVVTGPNGQPDKKVTVVFKNGDRVSGSVYAVNPAVDVALVKVDYAKLPPPLQLGDSSKLELGQWAIAVGEPLQLQDTVTLGVVSGFNRDEVGGGQDTAARRFSGLLQTSAPINPGNSGGPLVDVNGDVIGINQLTAQSAQNIGFAIPINLVKQAVEGLEKHPGSFNGPLVTYLGIYSGTVNNNVRQQLNYLGGGIVIAQVVPNSPASKAGLAAGAVIQAVDGTRISSEEQFKKIIDAHKAGDRLKLRVWFQGEVRDLTATLGSQGSGSQNIVQPPAGSGP